MTNSPRKWLTCIAIAMPLSLCLVMPLHAEDDPPIIVERGRAQVTARGFPPAHVDALAKAVDGMAAFYVASLGLDMPEVVTLNAHLDSDTAPALWIGDEQTIELRLQWQRHLERPKRSRVHVLYGLGYRLAELAMQRTLGKAPWLTDEAQRGLANYLSCVALERLYVVHGKSLWPDEYDYADDMGELKERMERSNESKIILACAAWHEWVQEFGGPALGALLTRWNNAAPDALRPKDALSYATIRATKDSYEKSKRKRWFRSFADEHIKPAIRKDATISAKRRGRLMRDQRVLKYDDDEPNEPILLTRGAHIITFKSPPDQWYLTEVRFYAERYGKILTKAKNFTITLRDDKFKKVYSWDKPYGLIRGRDPQWYEIRLDPVPVSSAFAITIEFESRRNTGIRLFKDTSSKGNSAAGSARRGIQPITDADWMIRAEIDRVKDDNPLIWRP